jgi:GT2 family glycosyltransferase
MLKIFKTTPKVGTVGCRLHFKDNTIQHNGILVYLDKEKKLNLGHIGFRSYYNYSTHPKEVIGSTGALLMIKKTVFELCNYFNENYVSCLEDVELNLTTKILGYNNICDSNLVSYHFESQTRDDESDKIEKFNKDYYVLVPFIEKNKKSLEKHIKIL